MSDTVILSRVTLDGLMQATAGGLGHRTTSNGIILAPYDPDEPARRE
jgi:hypothetical protein